MEKMQMKFYLICNHCHICIKKCKKLILRKNTHNKLVNNYKQRTPGDDPGVLCLPYTPDTLPYPMHYAPCPMPLQQKGSHLWFPQPLRSQVSLSLAANYTRQTPF